MKSLNLRLTFLRLPALALYMGVFCLSAAGAAYAQEAVPVEAIKQTALPDQKFDTPVVVELFSSQACIFCPQADRLFGDLIRQPNIIGLNCHVDYFDVRQGALSRPFCTDRQTWYTDTLGTGPHYTPQMIIQGRHDVVGYRMEDIVAGLQKAGDLPAVKLDIAPEDGASGYKVALPPDVADLAAPDADMWLALYDRPHRLTVAEGRNRGRKMIYHGIVQDLRNLGPWRDRPEMIEVAAESGHKGFAVLVQDPATGRILAAGQYDFPRPQDVNGENKALPEAQN